MSAIFLLPVCLTCWPRKYTTRVYAHVDNSHQVWTWYAIRCRVMAFLSADKSRDLVTLTFDVLTLSSCPAWRVTCPTLPPSFIPYAYPFFSYNGSRWLPLKMRTRPPRMRRITWAVSRGSKTITLFVYTTPISLYNFYWATTTSRLLSSVTNDKCKKLYSLKHLVRTTVAGSHN